MAYISKYLARYLVFNIQITTITIGYYLCECNIGSARTTHSPCFHNLILVNMFFGKLFN